MKRLLTAAILALSLTPLQALACDVKVPPINQSMSFGQARDIIMKSGWFKNSVRWQDVSEYGIEGRAKSFWNQGYSEVQYCLPTGTGACIFQYGDAFGNQLEVVTHPSRTYARDYNKPGYKESPKDHQISNWSIKTKAQLEASEASQAGTDYTETETYPEAEPQANPVNGYCHEPGSAPAGSPCSP